MTEFELKFQVEPLRRGVVEAAVARGKSSRMRLQARYFDTADQALAAARVVLRLRKEDRHWVQTAKAPGDGPLQRLEHNAPLPAPPRATEAPAPELARHDGTPVGERIAAALQAAGHDPAQVELVARHATDIRRITREMRTGDARVELAFDRGEVRAGERSHPICELEIELKSGSAHAMLELAGRWRQRYGLWLDTVSKSERGERLARGIVHGAPVKARPPRLAPRMAGPAAFRAVLDACLAQILPNASEVAAGSDDPEHVHQLRVGIRRLRTALREIPAWAPGLVDPAWDAALAHTFRALGQARDLEVMRHEVEPRLAAAGGPPVAWPEPDPPAPAARELVRAPAFQDVLMRLVAAALPDEDDAPALDADPRAARRLLRDRLTRLHRQVVRDGRRFAALDTEAQHRVRKRLKRLRYLGEFAASMFDARAARRYLEALTPAQDALGRHNDDAVAIAACREAAAQDGGAWFAVGWLSAQQPLSARACRKSIAGIERATPFWKAPKKR